MIFKTFMIYCPVWSNFIFRVLVFYPKASSKRIGIFYLSIRIALKLLTN